MSAQTYIRLRSKATGGWFVHPALRSMLIQQAAEDGTSVTDVVNRILASRYGGHYQPTGRPSRTRDDVEDQLTLRLDPDLRKLVQVIAAQNGEPWQDLVRRTLCDEYELPMPLVATG